MIIKEKILIEFDIPTISGSIYPQDLIIGLIDTIKKEKIGGVVYSTKEEYESKCTEHYGELEYKVPKEFYITNPKVIVDETSEDKPLVMVVDVVIEDNVTEDVKDIINNKPWRLSMVGEGILDEETMLVSEYKLLHCNIENAENLVYNTEK